MKRTFQVGDIEAPSGQLATGLLRVGELADGCSPIHIPVMIINGTDDGPVVYLHGGSHGQETICSIEMMRQLAREELDPAGLCGAVVMVPVANLLAHQAATRIAPQYGVREGGAFGGDMHRLWPGDKDGSLTHRLSHAIWTQIVAQSDVVLDFHTNSSPGLIFVLMHENEEQDEKGRDVWRRTVEIGKAFGVTLAREAPCPTALAGASLAAGKPALTIELAAPRVLNHTMVKAGVIGTKNILVHLGMIDGKIVPQAGIPVLEGNFDNGPSPRANRGGVIHFEAECGVLVKGGAIIARIFDVFGNELEVIRMPKDGYISTFPALSWNGAQAIASGEWVADLFFRTPDGKEWLDV
jgi:predicted deacylase